VSEPYWKDLQQTGRQQRVRASLARCGNHVLTMVSKRVEAVVARPLLPDGAQLGPPGPDGLYLLLYTFGYEQFTRYAWMPPILSISYLETIVAVQGIVVPGSGGRMLGPLAGGGARPKALGRLSTGESDYRVATLGGSPVLSASFQLNGLLVNPFEVASYRSLCDFSSIPAVTKTPFGNLLCSILEFDREAAVAQPVIARIDVHAPDFPGLTPGIHTFTGTDAEPLLALRARFPWTLTTTRPEGVSGRISLAGAPAGR
jgi:hypothetical protein